MERIRSLIQSLVSSFAVLLVLIGLCITVLGVFGAFYLVGLLFEHVVFRQVGGLDKKPGDYDPAFVF